MLAVCNNIDSSKVSYEEFFFTYLDFEKQALSAVNQCPPLLATLHSDIQWN
jgi:hypothetical protein